MSYVSEVLIDGRPVSLRKAESHIFHHSAMTGYDPAEVNAIWSRLLDGDYEDAQDAAAELEAVDLDSSIEFILVDLYTDRVV